MKNVLANLAGIAVVTTLLVGSGAVCPTCGHGTRVTSKRWAKCKQCGERVPRRDMEDVAKELGDRIADSATEVILARSGRPPFTPIPQHPHHSPEET